jgi:hypothetical protein
VANLSIIIGKTVEEKLYFRVRNESGRILLTSREYSHFDKCINEIYAIQTYPNFEFEKVKINNGHQYTILGSWGRAVGVSPEYHLSTDMERDIQVLKAGIGRAEVVDHSSAIRFFRPVRI